MALSVVEKDGRELRIYENADGLSTDLAEYIAELSEASIKDHGLFTVALSGGSLISLLRKLCKSPHSKIVDWGKWHVFWADERAVSKNHACSNYKLAKEGLIAKVRIDYNHVYSINDSLTVQRAAERYQFVIRQLVRTRLVGACVVNDCPRFDLVLLRMGPDGHVAALFPNHPTLDEKEQWVTFMTDSPKAPPERITFTLPVINSASNVAVVVTGGKKAEAAHLAIDGVGPNDPDSPARMVRPRDGKLVWFLDSDAASKLDGVKLWEQS